MTTYYPGTPAPDPINPDPIEGTCANCEHSLDQTLSPLRHTRLGTGNGPNGTDTYRCEICGPLSGTHHNGQREGITEPRRSTQVLE